MDERAASSRSSRCAAGARISCRYLRAKRAHRAGVRGVRERRLHERRRSAPARASRRRNSPGARSPVSARREAAAVRCRDAGLRPAARGLPSCTTRMGIGRRALSGRSAAPSIWILYSVLRGSVGLRPLRLGFDDVGLHQHLRIDTGIRLHDGHAADHSRRRHDDALRAGAPDGFGGSLLRIGLLRVRCDEESRVGIFLRPCPGRAARSLALGKLCEGAQRNQRQRTTASAVGHASRDSNS